MKKILKTVFLTILTAALVFMVIGCELGGDEEQYNNPSGLDDTNYTREEDRAFYVENNTNKRLVAFKNGLSTSYGDKGGTILGVIPVGAGTHGIAKKYVGSGPAGFTMILIEEDVYIANKNNLSPLEQSPFTRIFVVYNNQGDNNVVYRISGRLGGTNKLEIPNPQNNTWNIELRLGGTSGETLGFAPTGSLLTNLYLADGEYLIFPVFHRYNSVRDVVETRYPFYSSGPNAGAAFFDFIGLGPDGSLEHIFNTQDAMELLSSASSGAAWLVVNNQSNMGIRVIQGSTPYRTASGMSVFNPNQSRSFPINMEEISAGNAPGSIKFASTKYIASWRAGPPGYEVDITDGEGNREFTFYADKSYTLNFGGSMANGFTAVIEMRDGEEHGPEEVDFL